jgi:hypothetical protein
MQILSRRRLFFAARGAAMQIALHASGQRKTGTFVMSATLAAHNATILIRFCVAADIVDAG